MSDLNQSTRPLVQLTLMRFREFLREPETVFWTLVFPILLAAGLGLAFRETSPAILSVAATTPALSEALGHEKLLDVRMLSREQAEEALRVGKVALVAESDPQGDVVYRYDDSIADARTARLLADRAIQRADGQSDPVHAEDVRMVEPGSRYIDFLIPGLLGMNLMSSAIWGVGFTIADLRRRKMMKRLIATPMPRSSYLLSFVVHRLVLTIVEITALLAFAVLVFQVPLLGSLSVLLLTCFATTLTFTALGLLIASRVRTIDAAAGLMNFIVLPMWIVSGVFFSAERFPDYLQPIIKILPLTASIEALRANILQGAGLAQILPQLAILATWTTVCFPLALKIFRWR